MDSSFQDFIHAASVLETVKQRMIQVGNVVVAGMNRIVKTEDNFRMVAKNPSFHDRGEKWKNLSVNYHQIEPR
jgi:hypothetical protein